jgi:hypothetical protein
MKFASRLNRLERLLGRSLACGDRPDIVMIVDREPGEPDPPIPDGVPLCRHCGRYHVLVVEEVVVASPPRPAPRQTAARRG